MSSCLRHCLIYDVTTLRIKICTCRHFENFRGHYKVNFTQYKLTSKLPQTLLECTYPFGREYSFTPEKGNIYSLSFTVWAYHALAIRNSQSWVIAHMQRRSQLDNWAVHIPISVYTHHEINRFKNKLIMQNKYEYRPLNYRTGYKTVLKVGLEHLSECMNKSVSSTCWFPRPELFIIKPKFKYPELSTKGYFQTFII